MFVKQVTESWWIGLDRRAFHDMIQHEEPRMTREGKRFPTVNTSGYIPERKLTRPRITEWERTRNSDAGSAIKDFLS